MKFYIKFGESLSKTCGISKLISRMIESKNFGRMFESKNFGIMKSKLGRNHGDQ